jgi:hypothetical protein
VFVDQSNQFRDELPGEQSPDLGFKQVVDLQFPLHTQQRHPHHSSLFFAHIYPIGGPDWRVFSSTGEAILRQLDKNLSHAVSIRSSFLTTRFFLDSLLF